MELQMSKFNIDLSTQIREFKKGQNSSQSQSNGFQQESSPYILDERVTQLESLKAMNELTM
jgi:hypothetical protein